MLESEPLLLRAAFKSQKWPKCVPAVMTGQTRSNPPLIFPTSWGGVCANISPLTTAVTQSQRHLQATGSVSVDFRSAIDLLRVSDNIRKRFSARDISLGDSTGIDRIIEKDQLSVRARNKVFFGITKHALVRYVEQYLATDRPIALHSYSTVTSSWLSIEQTCSANFS